MYIFDGEKTLVNHEIPEGIWSIPPNWNLVSLLGGPIATKDLDHLWRNYLFFGDVVVRSF